VLLHQNDMALRQITLATAAIVAAASTLIVTAPPASVSDDSRAGMYALSRSDTAPVYLSWLQPVDNREYQLLFAKLQPNGGWSRPRVIATGDKWFINQADRPSIEVLGNGSLVAHWLVRNGDAKAKYGYGLQAALSQDGGDTWRTIYRAGLQNAEDYTGFLSFLPERQGFGAAYLSPPEKEVSGHIKTLRFAEFGAHGEVMTDAVVDTDVCTCCPTATAMTPNGPVIVYRDRRPNETRDISIVRRVGHQWLEPQAVSVDGWQINGCPSDGPALAAKGEQLVVAWFTRAHDIPQIKVAFSNNSGRDFTPAIRVDAFSPVGRADVQLVGKDTAVVSWIEKPSGTGARVCVRRVSSSGQMGDVQNVGLVAEGRSAGFPKIRVVESRLLVVWKGDRLLSQLIAMPSLPRHWEFD
jgi:hypothetical protein